jgi:hypothetical protein
MALLKSVETNYGVNASYWKISRTNINWYDGVLSLELWGFFDEAARRANKSTLNIKEYVFGGDDFANFRGNEKLLDKAYEMLKGLEEWQGSENV